MCMFLGMVPLSQGENRGEIRTTVVARVARRVARGVRERSAPTAADGRSAAADGRSGASDRGAVCRAKPDDAPCRQEAQG